MFKPATSPKKDYLKHIEIKFEKDIPPELIQQLYLSVGWHYRESFEIKRALEGSFLVASAWVNDMLIGLARATGDGVFSVTIWDFAIKPAFQKQGIGRLLLKSMLNKLNDYNIPLITLYSELDKKDFYSKLGFECGSKKIIGMYKYSK